MTVYTLIKERERKKADTIHRSEVIVNKYQNIHFKQIIPKGNKFDKIGRRRSCKNETGLDSKTLSVLPSRHTYQRLHEG